MDRITPPRLLQVIYVRPYVGIHQDAKRLHGGFSTLCNCVLQYNVTIFVRGLLQGYNGSIKILVVFALYQRWHSTGHRVLPAEMVKVVGLKVSKGVF